jgi:hypothetical protein
MSGSITLDGTTAPLSTLAISLAVYRFDPTQSGQDRYQLVPNVVCEQIERVLGPHPSTARLRYLLDNSGMFPDWPNDFGQIWPQTAQSGPYVLVTDDRIAVVGTDSNNNSILLFDGFCQIPQVNLSQASDQVTFVATGVECRSWDTPIPGRLQRDADLSFLTIALAQIQTDLPTRFNPSDGRGGVLGNCIPDGDTSQPGANVWDYWINASTPSTAYPVFMEERYPGDVAAPPATLWTVAKAVIYILSTANAKPASGSAQLQYVANPSMTDLLSALVVKVPVDGDGDGVVDPTNPATYTVKDMPVRDMDVQNKNWPDVLEELLGMVGFGFYFTLPVDAGDSSPTVGLAIFRLDQSGRQPTDFLLDAFGNEIDPTANDVTSLALARDLNGVANAFSVETMMRRYEVSIVLGPGFSPTHGDGAGLTPKQFLSANIKDAPAAIQRKYRWYVADECSEGFWDTSGIPFFNTAHPFDFTPIMPINADGRSTYVRRYRPGANHLLTLDDQKRPRQKMLHCSFDYVGKAPAVWDGTGTWFLMHDWKLLEHRLGIECTADNPEEWNMGNLKWKFKGITWLADPPAVDPVAPAVGPKSGRIPTLMLTTVIDDDIMLPAVVPMRVASPTKYERRRRIDARDHYRLDTVVKNSWFNNATWNAANGVGKVPPVDTVVRNDTDTAIDLARQYRTTNEMPRLAGSATIPYITTYYDLSNMVSMIAGRNIALYTNAASDKGEGARYPLICKITWNFSGDQQTTQIQLTDLRGEPRVRFQ